MKGNSLLKLLCIVCVITLIASFASGCTTTGTKKNENEKGGETAKTTDGSAEVGLEKERPVVDIQYLFPFSDWSSEVYENIKNDRIKKYIEDKLNIRLEYKSIRTELNTKIRLAFSTGEGPDLICTFPWDNDSSEIFKKAVEEDLLVDMTTYVAKNPSKYKALNIAFNDPTWKMFNEVYLGDANKNLAIYGYDKELWTGGGIVFNTKYMKALNLDTQPKTVDEFIEILRVIKKGDPDGNGKPDTIPFSWLLQKGTCPLMSETDLIFGSTHGVTTQGYMQDNDGNWYDPSVTDDMKNYIKTMAGWYKEGLFDIENMTKEYYSNADDLIAGKVAATTLSVPYPSQYKWLYDKWKVKYPDATPDDLTMLEWPLQGPAGTQKNSVKDGSVGSYHYIPTYTKNPERVVELLGFMMSDEGQMLWGYGIEGTHYTKDANGNIKQNIDEMRKDIYLHWPTAGDRLEYQPFAYLSAGSVQTMIQIEKAGGWLKAFDNQVNTFEERQLLISGGLEPSLAYATPINKNWVDTVVKVLPSYMSLVSWSAAETKLRNKCNDIKQKWFTEFYLGQKDIDKEWENFVKAYLDEGAEELVKVYNSKVNEVKKIYNRYNK